MDRETRRLADPAAPAAGPLRGRVAYRGYDVAGLTSGTHRGLPSPYLTFVVGIDDPVVTLGPHGRVPHDTVVGGLHTEPVTIVHAGRQRGVHVSIDPVAARALLGAPAGELPAADLDGGDVFGALAAELHDQVNATPDWVGRFAVLDELLRRHAAPEPTPVRDEVRRAWRRLVAGGAGVREVAEEVGWSERHLERCFRDEFGLGPKVAARMARFDRVRHRLARRAAAGAPLGLAELAADGGYADQAHLAREFGALAGCSPTRWVAEEVVAGEVGNIQDASAPDTTSSPA